MSAEPGDARLRLAVKGAVQGVGFRPFVYRLALELGLNGWVLNSNAGVRLEVEGEESALHAFLVRFEKELPPRAMIQSLESSFLDPVGYGEFQILESDDDGDKTTLILPDIATCTDCLREVFDPLDRRFGYPFTNCTNCGPRFSIITALPYDRAHTSMKDFVMCVECEREYHDPLNRRFHAQPNACPQCGPQIALWDHEGNIVATKDGALREAVKLVREGKIVALKGLGGFQFIADALNDKAITRLRERKHRVEKPFAVMLGSLASAHAHCELSAPEIRLLTSPEAPIVLAKRRHDSTLAPAVAPRNPFLGIMLPCTPLHHLLLRELDSPIIATSGNATDEPICIDEDEAVRRLSGIADAFLVHNRPIVRQVDDSITRIMQGRELVLRRARGFAPLPITLRHPLAETVLAVGAHLKNTVALGVGANIFVSQHLGDLETEPAYAAFRRTTADLPRLYDRKVDRVVCDLHPEYLSTKFATELAAANDGPALTSVQHHWAHIAACMAENEIAPPALGIAWDGTGYGTDGTIWGGEFLRANDDGSFARLAHLRPFRLAGGERAVREPRRSALGVLYEVFGEELWSRSDLLAAFTAEELPVLRQMLSRSFRAPVTTSAGRLFDAIASLLDLRQRASFEGQAAMELEFAIAPDVVDSYSFTLTGTVPIVVDWATMIREILSDLKHNVAGGIIAAKFQNAMSEAIVAIAIRSGETNIVLSGGCFQNRYLTERTIELVRAAQLRPYWHQRIPPNDGGIALGQIAAASLLPASPKR